MIDLAGLTNAITDILIPITEEELKIIGLRKGFYNSKSGISYADFIGVMSKKKITKHQGGSPANVIHNAASFQIRTALFGNVGNDSYGDEYIKSLEKAGIESYLNQSLEPKSGVCYVMVTPDGEKTSIANMGIAGEYDFDLAPLKETKLFHTSGYELMTNPDRTLEAIAYAKSFGSRISFDLADPRAVKQQRQNVEKLLDSIDILFATVEEASELAKIELNSILNALPCPIIALKLGNRGSVVKAGEQMYQLPICPVKVVNTNGAGDAYAGGFLTAYLKGSSVQDCGKFGSYVASLVVGKEESHL